MQTKIQNFGIKGIKLKKLHRSRLFFNLYIICHGEETRITPPFDPFIYFFG